MCQRSHRWRRRTPAVLILLLSAAAPLRAGEMPLVLSLAERAAAVDGWLETRVREVLPEVMRRATSTCG